MYSKLNLKVQYPPSHARKIWDYNRSETDLIKPPIESFDWSNLFSVKNVHKPVETKYFLQFYSKQNHRMR